MHEGALVEAFEECGYVLVDLDAAGAEEFLAGCQQARVTWRDANSSCPRLAA
jgi:hypothetical protein